MNTHPFTIEEYQRLKEVIIPIKEFLADNHLSFIWGSYMRLENRHEGQPCSCPSAAKYWAAAVTALKEFIKKTEEENK
jgi:hypothetical protein